MQIFNAKSSSITIPLDNGQLIRVAPGKCSEPFIGTAPILLSIIALGSPKEVGVIVSSSYELDLIRQVSASMEYLFQNESDARTKLLEGKEIVPTVSDNPYAIELQKTKEQLTSANSEIEKLIEEIKKLKESASDQSELERLRNELRLANEDTAQARADHQTANATIDELNFRLVDKDAEIKQKEETITALSAELNDTKSKLELELSNTVDVEQAAEKSNLVASLRTQVADLTAELQKVAAESAEPLSDEDKAKLENYEALEQENTTLKADGAKLFDNYNKAKDTVKMLMEKFNISYVDGQYVQTASPSKSNAE